MLPLPSPSTAVFTCYLLCAFAHGGTIGPPRPVLCKYALMSAAHARPTTHMIGAQMPQSIG